MMHAIFFAGQGSMPNELRLRLKESSSARSFARANLGREIAAALLDAAEHELSGSIERIAMSEQTKLCCSTFSCDIVSYRDESVQRLAIQYFLYSFNFC